MRDYTLLAYKNYLSALQGSYDFFPTFAELLCMPDLPVSFCAIRHDVDRDPINSLVMARIEKDRGLRSTYYFRTKRHTFKPDIIKAIADLGHDIGYHYESLSDCDGNETLAVEDFKENLEKLRHITPIQTVAMHGQPLSSFDNRCLWLTTERRAILHDDLHIFGEVYLDLDYTDVAYITDASRQWGDIQSGNIRDHVNSKIELPFNSGGGLLKYIETAPPAKLVWQIHPERWNDDTLKWYLKYGQDMAAVLIKKALRRFGYYSRTQKI
jgi:hypothetical protein